MICNVEISCLRDRFALAVALIAFLAVGSVSTSSVLLGQDEKQESVKASAKPLLKDDSTTSFEEQEAKSIEFVQLHHPDLVGLMQLLKTMKNAEYKVAVREIVKTRKRIESLDKREPELAAVELESWKIQSKIDLFMAKAVARADEVDSSQLKNLVAQRIEIQKKRLKLEQANLVTRQKAVEESLSKIEGHESDRISQQLNMLLKKIEAKSSKSNKNKSVDKEVKNP